MTTNPWPVTSEVLHKELESLQEIVTKWAERFGSEQYVTELDREPELFRDQIFNQFVNEMKVVAAKSATIVEVLR